mmetsp:Transcript_8453/g.24231  ORF Transcript_8453/g.24231 Transcript_8453/m.24231 type:complete len:203 (+) Transcript_8453:22-630(+)
MRLRTTAYILALHRQQWRRHLMRWHSAFRSILQLLLCLLGRRPEDHLLPLDDLVLPLFHPNLQLVADAHKLLLAEPFFQIRLVHQVATHRLDRRVSDELRAKVVPRLLQRKGGGVQLDDGHNCRDLLEPVRDLADVGRPCTARCRAFPLELVRPRLGPSHDALRVDECVEAPVPIPELRQHVVAELGQDLQAQGRARPIGEL